MVDDKNASCQLHEVARGSNNVAESLELNYENTSMGGIDRKFDES